MQDKNTIVEQSTIHQNGRPETLLGPKTVDLKNYGPTDHPNYRKDGALVAVGSTVRLLEKAYKVAVTQGLTPNGLAAIIGAASTPSDIEGLVRIAEGRPFAVRTGHGWLFRREVIHPNSPVVRAGILARGAFQGNGADVKTAVERLQTDILLRAELDSVVSATAGTLATHRQAGITKVSVRGFGGTDPWAEYVNRCLKTAIKVNMNLDLRLIPAREETLNRENAKGTLYNMLSKTVPDDTLILAKALCQRGRQADDSALMAGVLVITGNSYASDNPDAATLFRTLRAFGAYVEVRAAEVNVPLAQLETSLFGWRWIHQIRAPEAESPGLRILLGKVLSLVSLDADAMHVLVVAGSFTAAEERAIRKATTSMAAPGHIIPVVAHMYPKVVGPVAKYLVCDFVAAPQLPRSITSVFLDGDLVMSRSGLTRQEFLDRMKAPSEWERAKEVDKVLDWLCRLDG